MQLASRSAKEGPWLDFTATWYTPAGGVGNGLTTASGMKVSEEVVAVDPSVIPLGTVIEVKFEDGRIERKIAADTGGAVKGRKVDIFCWNHQEAIQNGRQKIQLRVIGHAPLG